MTDIPPNAESVRRMAVFDGLPGRVRAALNSAAFPYDVAIFDRLLRRGKSEEQIVALLARLDRRSGWKGGAA